MKRNILLLLLPLLAPSMRAQSLQEPPKYETGTYWLMSAGRVDEAGDTTWRDDKLRITVTGDTTVRGKACWIMKGNAEGPDAEERETVIFLVCKRDLSLLSMFGVMGRGEWKFLNLRFLYFPLQPGRIWKFAAQLSDRTADKDELEFQCKVAGFEYHDGIRGKQLDCENHACRIDYIMSETGRPGEDRDKVLTRAWYLFPEGDFPGTCPAMLFFEAEQNDSGSRNRFLSIEDYGVNRPE